MSMEGAINYLETLGKVLSDHITEWYVEEGEEPALIFTAPSLYDENTELGYAVSVIQISEEMILLGIMVTIAAEIPEDRFKDMHRLAEEMNNLAVIGSFTMFEDTSALICRQGAVFSVGSPLAETTANMICTIGILESSASKCRAVAEDILSGKLAPENAIDKIMEMRGDAG